MTLPTTCLVLAVAVAAAHAGDADGTEATRPTAKSAAATTLDDLVRAAGLDARLVSAQLGRERDASPAHARFALIFCPVHGRYEPRSGASRFSKMTTGGAVDPLFD